MPRALEGGGEGEGKKKGKERKGGIKSNEIKKERKVAMKKPKVFFFVSSAPRHGLKPDYIL